MDKYQRDILAALDRETERQVEGFVRVGRSIAATIPRLRPGPKHKPCGICGRRDTGEYWSQTVRINDASGTRECQEVVCSAHAHHMPRYDEAFA